MKKFGTIKKNFAHSSSFFNSKFHSSSTKILFQNQLIQLIVQRKMSSSKPFVFAGIQMLVTADKEKNLLHAKELIHEAANKGAKVVSLPECFNCPYSNDSFPPYSEFVPGGPSTEMLSKAAKENQIYLIGGSIPERDANSKLYNTSTVWGPDGKMLAKHRKIHLFDIDIPGKMTFQESKTLSFGNSITTFDTEFCKFGVGICYDIRFPEMAELLRKEGCKFICYPGAFNMVTGPAHWELLARARAVDCQLFVASVSPARNPDSTYQAWGHSMIVSPWGEVIATTEHNQDIIYATIDLQKVEDMRQQIPTSKQKRSDLYSLQYYKKE